jgi:hypothetical protein
MAEAYASSEQKILIHVVNYITPSPVHNTSVYVTNLYTKHRIFLLRVIPDYLGNSKGYRQNDALGRFFSVAYV